MSFQMHVPRQAEPVQTNHRRRRRVKKTADPPANILEQPITLSDTVAGIPLSVLNSLPMETPVVQQPVISISRSVVNINSESEEYLPLLHVMPDSTLKIKRVRLLCSVDSGMSTIRVVNMETGEEILTETVDSEELSIVELAEFPETFSDTLVIEACPGGFTMEIPQVEIWSEICSEASKE